MIWNEHYKLRGQHALLSGSRYQWIRYDQEKLIDYFHSSQAAKRGTEIHDLAAKLIDLGVKLPRSNKTLNMYVNDAIGFKMNVEQTLYYSDNCFCHADTICFRKNVLRIHDLKTGITPAKMDQLLIEAAVFCLEYRVKPSNIETELRIYQNDEVLYHVPEPNEIKEIMEKIVEFDKILLKLKEEV